MYNPDQIAHNFEAAYNGLCVVLLLLSVIVAVLGIPLLRREIKSGAASPARRISSTDPANGDPGEANT